MAEPAKHIKVLIGKEAQDRFNSLIGEFSNGPFGNGEEKVKGFFVNTSSTGKKCVIAFDNTENQLRTGETENTLQALDFLTS